DIVCTADPGCPVEPMGFRSSGSQTFRFWSRPPMRHTSCFEAHRSGGARRFATFAFLTVAAAVAAACGGGSPEGAGPGGPGGGAMMGVPVEAVTLAPRPVERSAEFVGIIRSRRSTTIQPQAEGFLVRILVTSGARVSAGTPLFEIDAPSERAALAALESTRAARQADAEFARQQAERAKALYDVGATSLQEFEQATTVQRTAEAQLRAAEEQIRQQEAQLAYFRVVAP